MNDTERQLKRYFQWLKDTSFAKFRAEMNRAHGRAYKLAEKHFTEAAFITLQPKQRDILLAKVKEIREGWDDIYEDSIEFKPLE